MIIAFNNVSRIEIDKATQEYNIAISMADIEMSAGVHPQMIAILINERVTACLKVMALKKTYTRNMKRVIAYWFVRGLINSIIDQHEQAVLETRAIDALCHAAYEFAVDNEKYDVDYDPDDTMLIGLWGHFYAMRAMRDAYRRISYITPKLKR